MAERDRFELDLAAALRAYLEEAPTEVRPTELARQFATAYPHRRAAFGRWGVGLTPAVAWLVLLIGLLVLLAVGGLVAGSWRPDQAVVVAPSPSPTPIPSLPLEIQGSWSTMSTSGEGSATLALTACAVGEKCGILGRIDDNGEHCIYGLVYSSGGTDSYRLKTGLGNSFGCAYSAWSYGVVHLQPQADGTLHLFVQGDAVSGITLFRIEPMPSSDPSPSPGPPSSTLLP